MSSTARQQSTELGTIIEAPLIDRKISGSPDPLDNDESMDPAQVSINQFKTGALHIRGNTIDEHSARTSRVICDSQTSTRAHTFPLNSSNVITTRREFRLPRNVTGTGSHDIADSITGVSRLQSEPQACNGSYSRRNTDEDKGTFAGPTRHSTNVWSIRSDPFTETEAWDKKALLSLDGGGIRGYSSLLVLKELMVKIAKIEQTYPEHPAATSFHPLEPPSAPSSIYDSSDSQHSSSSDGASNCWLPCHYFDYMAGTSTGGLISIMLGRLRMNIDDCIKDYERLGDKVFGHSRWFHLRSPLWWPRDKYSHNTLRDVIQQVVNERVPRVANFPGGKTFAYDENRCRTIVLAYQKESTHDIMDKPYIFRTYKNLHRSKEPLEALMDRNPDLAHDIPIWEVARATSAAPTYFEPVKIEGLEYIDGGFGANNPSDELYREVKKMHNGSTKAVRLLISIGTGINTSSTRFTNKSGIFRYLNYMNFAKKWATDSQRTHGYMIENAKQDGFKYHRLNVEDGIGNMKLDEWNSRGKLRRTTGCVIGHCRRMAPKAQRPAEQPTDGETNGEKFVNRTDATHDYNTIRIPEWFQARNKTLEYIRKHTNAYLESESIQRELDECAKLLVDGRRLRAEKDPERWARTCYGAWYQCNIEQCLRGEKEYQSKESLRIHFLDKHCDQFTRDERDKERLGKALDSCKITVQ